MLKVAWSDIYNHPLPKNHRFPMDKYDLLPEQLLYEGTLNPDNLFKPGKLTEKEILSTHCDSYWKKLKEQTLTRAEERASGFPLSQALVDREITINSGTLEATNYALNFGISMNVAGGTHHAYTNRAEGFCLLNDQAIAARNLLDQGLASQILIVDLDVHQGNGTAEIFKEDPSVFTFSMHGARNYPMRKEQSDLDIGLPDGIDDTPYLKLLDHHLKTLLDTLQPNFIFFQSGVDVLATDNIGRLGLSIEGCKSRDALVLESAKRNNIPLVASMGGGYSPDIKTIVEAHSNTYRLAQELYF